MRLDRAGEIDFYEELGVERAASAEEIRDSFRGLVRLLHPDHQQDPALKTIAEKQLRKLNRIYAVLSDPDRRRSYDVALAGESRPPSLVFGPLSAVKARELLTRFLWIGAAVVGVSAVIWLATDSPAPPVLVSLEKLEKKAAEKNVPAAPAARSALVSGSPVLPSAQASGPDEVNQLRAALRSARIERDEAKRELDELKTMQTTGIRAQLAPPVSSPAPPAGSGSSLISASTTLSDPPPPKTMAAAQKPASSGAVPPAVRKPPVTEAQKFAGFWFFSKPAQANRNKGLYYPEFIEATLTEQNGVVHGRYRSRYQIVDRAISPDVNFEFSGTPSSGTIVCPWVGAGGAKGQLTIRMTGENDIKVDWSASDVGSIQGLASGTATLTRRLE